MIKELLENLKKYKIDILKHKILNEYYTRTQFQLMLVLICNKDRFMSRAEILKEMGVDWTIGRNIDVQVNHIRDKFGCFAKDQYPIESKMFYGYKISPKFLTKLGL